MVERPFDVGKVEGPIPPVSTVTSQISKKEGLG